MVTTLKIKGEKMRWLKNLLLVVVLFSITACNSKESVEDVKLKPYSVKLEKGLDMNGSIWGDKPSYKLKIKGMYAEIEVLVNGVSVYKHFDLTSCYREQPINHLVTTGENEIKVLLVPDNAMHERAKVTVSLEVHSSENGRVYTLSTIDYDEEAKDKLAKSSEAREYERSYLSPLTPETIKVSGLEQKRITGYQGDRINGIALTQKVSFRTPFPRWKFLDSEDTSSTTFDEPSETTAYEAFKSTKEMQELYAIYEEIHRAIKEGKISSIIDMFDERSTEMDRAYYRKKGYNKEGLVERLVDVSTNWEIREFNPKKTDYFIENNRKLIYLKVIRFKNSDGLYRTLGMTFRRDNGKWILTR